MTEYLRIVFQNLEPVRISDDSTSQSGQTVTLRYIPGSALRGIVLNTLAQEEGFASMKKDLLSAGVRFLNAFPADGERELIPSPKGFYEDKSEQPGKKEIENVVIDGKFSEGHKRAALGRFCYMEGDCISYYNVDTGSDLKIKINLDKGEKQNVFRNEYISANHIFTGYIAVDDDSLKEPVKQVFSHDIIVGNGRSAGLGKCRILSCGYTAKLPYQEYLPAGDLEEECYMMLLSHTVMRDEKGELCGIDCGKLQGKMGVDGLKICYCSSSVVDVRGRNRIWKSRIPSAAMYEQGSVFHLKYRGTFTADNMLKLCSQGIGIRRNEGFGRVIFLKDYEAVRYKRQCSFANRAALTAQEGVSLSEEDKTTLTVAAKGYYRNMLERKMTEYVVKHPLSRGESTNSQLGILESFATAYKYEPKEAVRAIRSYFDHAFDKEQKTNIQKDKASILALKKEVERILDTGIDMLLFEDTEQKDSVMGIRKSELLDLEEVLRLKLGLITKMIRFDNKKEDA